MIKGRWKPGYKTELIWGKGKENLKEKRKLGDMYKKKYDIWGKKQILEKKEERG